MMKCYRFRMLLLVLLCFSGFSGNAQTPSWIQAAGVILPGSANGIMDIKTDTAGNVYVFRYETGVSKYSPNGVLLWSKNIPAGSFSKDAAGNVYLTGVFSGNLTIDHLTLSCSPIQIAVFIIKIDQAGNVVWGVKSNPKGKIAPADGSSLYAYRISTDSAGSSLVAGYSYGDVTFGSVIIAPASHVHATHFLVKLNPAGIVEWAHENAYQWPTGIAIGSLDTYYLISPRTIMKFSGEGKLLWERSFTTTPGGVAQHSYIALDKNGNCFISGITSKSMVFDSVTLDRSGLYNNYLLKYKNTGELLWAKINEHLSDSSYSGGGAIDIMDSTVYLTGSFYGATTFDKRLPALTTPLQKKQVFVAKFSADTGMPYWMKQTTQSDNASGWDIKSLPSGEIIVAGMYDDSGCTFDGIQLPAVPTSKNNFFVARLFGGATAPLEPITEPEPELSSDCQIGFQFFPNPATGKVTLCAPGFENGNVIIYNTAGQRIFSTMLSERGKLSVNVSSWASGMYLFLFQAKDQLKTKKLIVSH